jgi:hypothetical protein
VLNLGLSNANLTTLQATVSNKQLWSCQANNTQASACAAPSLKYHCAMSVPAARLNVRPDSVEVVLFDDAITFSPAFAVFVATFENVSGPTNPNQWQSVCTKQANPDNVPDGGNDPGAYFFNRRYATSYLGDVACPPGTSPPLFDQSTQPVAPYTKASCGCTSDRQCRSSSPGSSVQFQNGCSGTIDGGYAFGETLYQNECLFQSCQSDLDCPVVGETCYTDIGFCSSPPYFVTNGVCSMGGVNSGRAFFRLYPYEVCNAQGQTVECGNLGQPCCNVPPEPSGNWPYGSGTPGAQLPPVQATISQCAASLACVAGSCACPGGGCLPVGAQPVGY